MTKPDLTQELLAFVLRIARMTPDGEEDFVMENDDAVSTVGRLIEEARAITAELPEELRAEFGR